MGWDLHGSWVLEALPWLSMVGIAGMAGTGALAWRMRGQLQVECEDRWRERRMREELEAYARVEPGVAAAISRGLSGVDATRAMAMRVCRVIAEKSAFSKVAIVLRDAEGRLYCAGRVGVDDLTGAAVEDWGKKVVEEERGGMRRAGEPRASKDRGDGKSFSIPLGEWHEFDHEVGSRELEGKKERRKHRRGLVAPMRTSAGKLIGAIVVCADGTKPGWPVGQERAMGPLETLAARLAGSLENEGLSERVLRAEKLAGLGQLAGGVAHALNNPLTAVLGFAELIAESSGDARVRKDAGVIVLEALKMKDTIQRLTEFWRPSTLGNDAVDAAAVVRELAEACTEKLEKRGIQLMTTVEDQLPPVRGSHDRIKQVLEHLMNNASQAIQAASEDGREQDGREHAIRITASHDGRMVNLIVSDTGDGFGEPGRVFDPFYTTKQADYKAGLGLSICYGIVREHEGEISAFNLHPFGAAVVIELPARKAVQSETGPGKAERVAQERRA